MTAPSRYTNTLLALLPPGRLWRWVGSNLFNLFAGCADELDRFDGRVTDLLNEADPRTASELLPDYETELDLVAAATTAERQANIVALTTARQGFKPADFQAALAPLFDQAAADVVIIERTHAQAVTMGDLSGNEIFRFFAYRDPTIPGTYYLASAQALIDKIKPSHTLGYAIESIDFLCDDSHSLCDRDLLGA